MVVVGLGCGFSRKYTEAKIGFAGGIHYKYSKRQEVLA
jgi:hypothetical protein